MDLSFVPVFLFFVYFSVWLVFGFGTVEYVISCV